MITKSARLPLSLLLMVIAVLVWSGFRPHDYFTWFLEVVPVLIAIPLLALSLPRFRFTPLVYSLMAVHAVILCIGGHYTYAQVPLFNWLRDVLDLSRNHYDRVGHFAQGFVPAMIVRELLIRTSPLRPGKWLFFIVIFSITGFSAMYELFEWATAAMTGARADDFLGTQGDLWDTQEDMALALIGATVAQLILGRLQDRQIEQALQTNPANKRTIAKAFGDVEYRE